MIVYDLECHAAGHRFEGWFGSSHEFESQRERGLLCCPECGSPDVTKAVQAPNVGRKGNQVSQPVPRTPQPMQNSPVPADMMKALARMQADALKSSKWVGDSFADDARAMHYGERDHESIHGEATLEQAKDLLEEGIAVAPLPFPVVPPEKAN